MLEKQIERKGNEIAKHQDLLHLKFTSPERGGVPDRLVLARVPPILRPIIARYIKFIEYKAPGKKPTAPQEREHARLRGMGWTVDVVDSVDGARESLRQMGDEE